MMTDKYEVKGTPKGTRTTLTPCLSHQGISNMYTYRRMPTGKQDGLPYNFDGSLCKGSPQMSGSRLNTEYVCQLHARFWLTNHIRFHQGTGRAGDIV